MTLRRGIRGRLGRRKGPRSRFDAVTERTRQEARALSRERRIEARRALRAQTESLDVGVRLKGAGYETQRLLQPVLAPVRAFFAWMAPYVSRSLLFVLKLLAALIALVLELVQTILRRLAALIGVLGLTVADWLRSHLTPRSTVAFVGASAAILLGASQFADYHGVAVDVPNYAGPIGRVAQAPITGTETAGSAHLWILLPVAAAALLFVLGAYRGSGRLAAGMVICGVIGLAVALAIDLPQGLDTGRPGLAFYGADAELLGGFWVEVTSSATLILCGSLLPLYSRSATRSRRRGRGGRGRASHRERTDVGGIPPGLQAES